MIAHDVRSFHPNQVLAALFLANDVYGMLQAGLGLASMLDVYGMLQAGLGLGLAHPTPNPNRVRVR